MTDGTETIILAIFVLRFESHRAGIVNSMRFRTYTTLRVYIMYALYVCVCVRVKVLAGKILATNGLYDIYIYI